MYVYLSVSTITCATACDREIKVERLHSCSLRAARIQRSDFMLYTKINIYIYTYIQVYIYMHLCIYVSMDLCIYASMHFCMYASMHVCIYASIEKHMTNIEKPTDKR